MERDLVREIFFSHPASSSNASVNELAEDNVDHCLESFSALQTVKGFCENVSK